MRFFFDNTCPPKLARALNVLLDRPYEARHLQERFDPHVDDITWIQTLAKERNWVVITYDLRIVKNPQQRRAWQESGLTTFFLKGWANQDFWLQASRLMQWWPDIMNQAKKVSAGAGFIVPWRYSGKFEQPRLM